MATFGVVLACAGAAGVDYAWWATRGHRWVTIAEGEAYQSAAMAPEALLGHVRSEGLRAVIDLRDDCRDRVAAEAQALAGAGVRFFHLPTNLPPTDETVARFVEIVRDPRNRPVLMHCEHGEGRSVLFAALYRIAVEGMANEQARAATVRLPDELRFLRWFWPELGLLRDDKASFLLDWSPPVAASIAGERREKAQ